MNDLVARPTLAAGLGFGARLALAGALGAVSVAAASS